MDRTGTRRRGPLSFWAVLALAAWGIWVWSAYRRARLRAAVPRLEARVVDGPPARLVGISELGRPLLEFSRSVAAGWEPDPEEYRSYQPGRHELPRPGHPHEWPWVLYWHEHAVSGRTAIDPRPVLSRWARGPHNWARVGRARRFWPLPRPPVDAFLGEHPLAPLTPWRRAGLKALGDHKEARAFDLLFEDWRVAAWRAAVPGAPPEACGDDAPGRPRRLRSPPALRRSVRLSEGSGAGVLAGVLGEQTRDLTPPPGTPTTLSSYAWPVAPPGELLALVVEVTPPVPGRWYLLSETRSQRGFHLAFPPLTCGEGVAGGPEYLVWEVPSDVAPAPGVSLVLEEYRPDPAAPPSIPGGASLGALSLPGRGSDAGAGTGSRG